MSFQTETNPSNDFLKKVAQLSPTNPFYTPAYCAAMRAVGHDPVVFSCMEGKTDVACTGFIRSGRLNRSLEITSIPGLQADSVFWSGLLGFCRMAKVSILEVDSFGSQHAAIPSLGRETARKTRIEFVLSLRNRELWKEIRKGHRWSINRARKAKLELEITIEPGKSQAHSAMFAASMGRRKKRGEATPDGLDVNTCDALIRHEAGKLFQAVVDGRVMSSALVLMSDTGAYYQTAGTSSEGMECGASHFLIFEIAKTLQEQGMELFNLGGTEQDALGLQEFKAGFGADKVELEAAEFFLGSRVQKGLGIAFRLLRNGLGEPQR